MIRDIITLAAATYPPIRRAMLVGEIQTAAICKRRAAAMWVARQEGKSSTVIGKEFNRDHATVLAAVKRVNAVIPPRGADALMAMRTDHAIKWIESQLRKAKP